MSELLATAERLRIVKQAREDFIAHWALDQLLSEQGSSDRVCSDVLNSNAVLVETEDKFAVSTLFSNRCFDD